MVLANFGVWLGVIVGLGVKRVFFGRLRGVEYEVSGDPVWAFWYMALQIRWACEMKTL